VCLSGSAAPLALPGFVVSESNNSHGVGRPSSSVGPFLLPCIPPEACTGGPPELSGRDGCAPGYTGRRCGDCEDSHFRLGRECVSCTWAIVWPTAVLSLLVALLCASEALTFVRGSVSRGSSSLLRFLETLALFKHLNVGWPEPATWLFEASGLSNLDPAILRLGCFLGPPSTPMQTLLVPFGVNGAAALAWLVGLLSWVSYKSWRQQPSAPTSPTTSPSKEFTDITPSSSPIRPPPCEMTSDKRSDKRNGLRKLSSVGTTF
jgi:hypothetical protein